MPTRGLEIDGISTGISLEVVNVGDAHKTMQDKVGSNHSSCMISSSNSKGLLHRPTIGYNSSIGIGTKNSFSSGKRCEHSLSINPYDLMNVEAGCRTLTRKIWVLRTTCASSFLLNFLPTVIKKSYYTISEWRIGLGSVIDRCFLGRHLVGVLGVCFVEGVGYIVILSYESRTDMSGWDLFDMWTSKNQQRLLFWLVQDLKSI